MTKNYFQILTAVLLFISLFKFQSSLTVAEIALAEAASDSVEFEVSALCSPHSQIINPETVSFRFMPTSTQSGLQINATLSVDDGSEIISDENRFDTPTKGWVGSLFKGPEVSARYFCQEPPAIPQMHVSYAPLSDVQLLFGNDHNWAALRELDGLNSAARNTLLSLKKEEEEKYGAGNQTNNPYWLAFSMPVHSNGIFRTTLRYEVIN